MALFSRSGSQTDPAKAPANPPNPQEYTIERLVAYLVDHGWRADKKEDSDGDYYWVMTNPHHPDKRISFIGKPDDLLGPVALAKIMRQAEPTS